METDPRSGAASDWSCLGSDLTELILSYLPIRSIVRAAAVCKLWRSAVTQPSFSTLVSSSKDPWFFLCGQNNIFSKNNQAFGYDPESDEWIRLPAALFPSPKQEEFFIGSGGFFFFTTTSSTCSRFTYAPVLTSSSWRETPPLRFARCNPLVGVFSGRVIVVGGVRFIGGLVDIEDRLAVEIYDPEAAGGWELCPPMPAEFPSGNSSQWLSSALLGGRFYVSGIYSGCVTAFDVGKREWSGVRELRPAGVAFSYLVACGGRLLLAGLCSSRMGAAAAAFGLWRVEEGRMELAEKVGEMPEELLHGLFESDGDDKFASLKCVGLGDLIYVFNEEPHRVYPACVCRVGRDLKCRWRKLPELPSPVNRFHKVVSFCSNVSLDSVLR